MCWTKKSNPATWTFRELTLNIEKETNLVPVPYFDVGIRKDDFRRWLHSNKHAHDKY